MSNLLLIESPGKIATLKKILGPGWQVQASLGHFMALANDGEDRLGFDLRQDRVECRYVPSDRGIKVLSQLRAAVKQAAHVYLATDCDREGEAISWHLARELKLHQPRRIVYSEITEQAVRAALNNSRPINENLVSSQRARQCLDKLVGYKVSPLLWNSTGGRSAGRVQSSALHIVCQREAEINHFQPAIYWSVWVEYQEGFRAYFYQPRVNQADAGASLSELDDAAELSQSKIPESARVMSQAAAEQLVEVARTHAHQVLQIHQQETSKAPPPPFITSTLQQSAGSVLGFSPEQTMQVAQRLYEGVDLPNRQRKGVITYMRTDSVAMAPEFVESLRHYMAEYDPQNLPAKAQQHRSRGSAQEAHEAIRPTEIELTPDSLRVSLTADEYHLYDLIWRRALASQCASARVNKTTVITQSGSILWQAKGMTVRFAGFTHYWNNLDRSIDLPAVQARQTLRLQQAGLEQKQTQPPPRYTEPKLVQKMEAAGIGRPSTYAAIVKTLKQRDYVEVKRKVLHPTPLGIQTDQFLAQALPDLVQSEFTAQMEAALDAVAAGQRPWEQYLTSWNRSYLIPALAKAKQVIHQTQFSSTTAQSNQGRGRSQEQRQGRKSPQPKKTPGERKGRESSFKQPTPAKLTEYACPVCAQALETHQYTKDGQPKILLRCSQTTSRQEQRHQEVVYFHTHRGWWSPKYGELLKSSNGS